MLVKTLDTIQKTIARFETILELDDSLSPRDVYCIQTALTHLSYLTPYESKNEETQETVQS